MARICVITAGHLATCPRMLKAADALAAGLTLRALFPSILTAVLCRFPGGERVMAWLRLPTAPGVTMAP